MNLQPFKPVGMAHGLIQFETKSWTGAPDVYEVEFDTSQKTAACSCADSTYRKKNHFPIGSPNLCKHARKCCEMCWPVISRALGAPV